MRVIGSEVIGFNERSRRVDVPFNNWPPEVGGIWPKCPKTIVFFFEIWAFTGKNF